MTTITKALFAGCFASPAAGAVLAQDTPMVSDAMMFGDTGMVANAVNPADVVPSNGVIHLIKKMLLSAG